MDLKIEKISLFFERLKNLSFWQRLFKWSKFLLFAFDAYEEYKQLFNYCNELNRKVDLLNNEILITKKDFDSIKEEKIKIETQYNIIEKKIIEQENSLNNLKTILAKKEETIIQLESKIKEKDLNLSLINEKLNTTLTENNKLKEENLKLKQAEEERQSKFIENLTKLKAINDQIIAERQKEIEETNRREIERINKLKENWLNHQNLTQNLIKMICERNVIEYVEKVPFNGNPDNTIKICDEYIIFDAKSPSTEDFRNFQNYLKNQAEAAKKYARQENVKKDIFFVVPSNTLDFIDKFYYNMADYNVFIISIDALEPIILSLKKIEDYEFINELSPEERENICRIIGKFAHMTKRRIQIDHFFAKQFLGILSKCESDLPNDILEKVIEYERAEKLNPPQEKRDKTISLAELNNENKMIEKELEKNSIILLENFQNKIEENLPLYKNENKNVNK
ncbi:MAG: hypothetical protein N3A58_05905 [Spirochaetes bacterium]|nr:hypothetical protein [Spirochaetota bacterium]